MEKLYLCLYHAGEYDDYRENLVFVTPDKEEAERWVNRVNKIVILARDRYDKIREKVDDMEFYTRYNLDLIHEIDVFNSAVYREIEFRK